MQSDNRLLYASGELASPVHLSGTARVTLRLASSKPAANLVGLAGRSAVDGRTDWPRQPHYAWLGRSAEPRRARARRRLPLEEGGEPLEPGKFYNLTFDLQPDDQIIPAGKRIGLMIFSSDRDFTVWPKPGTELTIDIDKSTLTLPVVGGPAAFAKATSRPPELM